MFENEIVANETSDLRSTSCSIKLYFGKFQLFLLQPMQQMARLAAYSANVLYAASRLLKSV